MEEPLIVIQEIAAGDVRGREISIPHFLGN